MTFTRNGNDLHITTLPTTPWGLLTGCTQTVRTLDQRSIIVTFAKFKLSVTVPREGMPHKGERMLGESSSTTGGGLSSEARVSEKAAASRSGGRVATANQSSS